MSVFINLTSILPQVFLGRLTRSPRAWTPPHAWCGYKIVEPLWKTIWQLLRELNIYLPSDPGMPPLGIYPKERKAPVHTNAWT